MSNLPAEADADSTTTGPQALDTGVTRGTGETVEGGVDQLDQLRLDEQGKYEECCLNCKSWVSLGSKKGYEYAFRDNFLGKPCLSRATSPENCSTAASRCCRQTKVEILDTHDSD
jgi:hypothetical protein